ncbi:MAG: CPBP family intramembrane metalloprotease [Bacteroidetes bacterium]|jgi:membrane protease YdiL (CAAX protease family)|nr:CPBP family intramembrane metalloprotease [Bacteroidota bacterium]
MAASPDTASTPLRPTPSWQAYHRVSRTATYGFLAALPLLLLYEVMILIANTGQTYGVRISAEIWIKRVLASIGLVGIHVLTIIVVLVGVAIFFYERRKDIPIRSQYFGWIVAESAVYAVVVAFLVSTVVGVIFAAAPVRVELLIPPQLAEQSLWTRLALSIGAGIYEELVFRVLLVGGLYLALKHALPQVRYAYVLAAVVGALLFSGVHYVGALGDAFTVGSFMFRFLFGLALNVIFLARGFGVAAWTHALYDVMIVTGLMG